MGPGAILLFFAVIALLNSKNTTIKQVCDRLPYEPKIPLVPGPNGDGGYRIEIEGMNSGYIPTKNYTVLLTAPESVLVIESEFGTVEAMEYQAFTRFTINGRAATNTDDTDSLTLANEERVGSFLPFDDTTVVNQNCPNTISEVSKISKRVVRINWQAPVSGAGCVAISAMVFENSKIWYSDDGLLTRIVCESSCREETTSDSTIGPPVDFDRLE